MTSAMRKRFSSAALVSFAAAAIQVLAVVIGLTAASAQTYPSQLVRIVVPFTPGSLTDILGRAYADKLQEIWKRDVIVENKPGLAGTASTAKAAPDGYTLLPIANGHAIVETRNAHLTLRAVKDVGRLGELPLIPGL